MIRTSRRRLGARRPAGAAPVPHFVALLGVLREAAGRHLALLPDVPLAALRRRPKPGHLNPRVARSLDRSAVHPGAVPCTCT